MKLHILFDPSFRRVAFQTANRFGLVAAGFVALCHSAEAQSDRVVITSNPGYLISWDGNNGGYSNPEPGAIGPDHPGSAANGAVPFGSSAFLPGGVHDFINVNDGYYGNSSSWISDFAVPDPDPFVGLSFGQAVDVTSIAWSRDNGDDSELTPPGPYVDRAVGIYTLQFTTVANPDATTAEAEAAADGWVTIGTVQYLAGVDSQFFSAYLRHRFEVGEEGGPISATGLRIKVSDPGIAMDEIEVNPPADPAPPLSSLITVAGAEGYTLSWDGNNGSIFSPSSPAPAPVTRAAPESGTTAFGSSELTGDGKVIANVNDLQYGNNRGWSPAATDTEPYIGLNFGGLVDLKNIAWGRDNGDDTEGPANPNTDRALGLYTVQITRAANPGTGTAETGDPASGWVTVGTVELKGEAPTFQPYLRHRFSLATGDAQAPIAATGLRIKTPPGVVMDEIEANVFPALEQDLTGVLTLQPEAGYSILWNGNDGEFHNPQAGARAPNNDALAVNGAAAFGSSELDYGVHYIRKLNDGLYGNSSSWISLNGLGGVDDPDPFIGINFGKTIEMRRIAWGRDNGDTTEGGCGGTCADRWQGIYTLQVTTIPNPDATTVETGDPTTGWATFAIVDYMQAAPPGFNPSLRHEFEVADAVGNAIPATGLRIKVSNGTIAIDEIEVNASAEAVAPPIEDLLQVVGASGYSFAWAGDDGEFNNPNADAGPPDNLALAAKGVTGFGSSEFGGGGVHLIANINDGLYGNSHSWLPNFSAGDSNPFVGLNFGGVVAVRSVAWSRDNGNQAEKDPAGPYTDRALGTYTVQVTLAANPGVDTPETGDPMTGWATIGSAEYKAGFATVFNPHLRHRFNVSMSNHAIPATGLRIKVSSDTMVIDEIEVSPVPAIDNNVLLLTPGEGFSIRWDGNDGDFSTPNSPAQAPNNQALGSLGTIAFGSSEFNAGGVHLIANVNDGLYGNSHSWISDFANPDPLPFVGLNFGRTIEIENVAWGRDNGDDTDGITTDRAAGIYVLQFTTLPNPDATTEDTGDAATGWMTIGMVEYRGVGTQAFRQHLRHSFDLASEGNPISATGLRILAPNINTAIDEIEINAELPMPGQTSTVTILREDGSLSITWTGEGSLQSAPEVTGPWDDVDGAVKPHAITPSAGQQYYRVAR